MTRGYGIASMFMLGVLLSGCATFKQYPFNQDLPGNPVCLFENVCVKYADQKHKILHREFAFPSKDVTEKLWHDYNEEYDYIAKRRVLSGSQKTGQPPNPASPSVPPNLSGLGLSGGGFRSATFHLGVLQALQDHQKLDQFDYMSSVSGGSYISAWMLAHLGSNQPVGCGDLFDKKDLEGCGYDEYGYMVRTEKLEGVLNNGEDFVRHLRAHRSFIKEEGWWDGLSLAGAYIARLPFYYLFDLGLHIKEFHDIGNEVHLTNLYKDRIEQTFLRGKKEMTLADVNKEDAQNSRLQSPYMIVNGNLVNRGESQGSGKSRRLHRDNFNFEFTRHYTGSDGLGYVETAGFGLPVKEVVPDDEGRPKTAVVRAPPGAPSFRFSYAVEASGAAVDIDSVVNEFVRDVSIRNALQILLLPFNMNFEYQTWNFARGADDGLFGTLFDYFRMMTYQRIPNFVRTDARWIEITDGSFFDNLGVLSLLRRGVRHVAVGDATWDPEWKYNYLKFLKKETEEFNMTWCTPLPDPGEIVWQKDFWVKRPDGIFAVIHYIKPYACSKDLTGRECDENLHVPKPAPGDPNRKPILSVNPGAMLNGVPTHLAKIQGKANKDHNLMVTKVAKFAVSEQADNFPQTSTAIQSFGWEQFEAYRLLGYLMGKTYLTGINFDQEPAFTGACVEKKS